MINCEVNQVNIIDSCDLSINDGFKNLPFDEIIKLKHINLLSFSNDPEGIKSTGEIKISNVLVNQIKLEGKNSNTVVFRNIINYGLDLINFYTEEEIKFIGINEKLIKPTETIYQETFFHIENTDLNLFQFQRFNFDSYKKIKIQNSFIADAKFFNITWKVPLLEADKTKIEDQQQARETYRQLKLAMKKQEDYLRQIEFYSFEMRAHFIILRLSKQNFSKDWYKISYWSDWINRVNLYLSKSLTNFGQSFWRPFLGLIIFTSIWSFLYTFQELNNWPILFIKFLSPFSKLTENGMNWWKALIDLLSRITSAYFLFHIIRFTRKYVNK